MAVKTSRFANSLLLQDFLLVSGLTGTERDMFVTHCGTVTYFRLPKAFTHGVTFLRPRYVCIVALRVVALHCYNARPHGLPITPMSLVFGERDDQDFAWAVLNFSS